MIDLGSIDLEIQGEKSPGDLEIGELALRQHRVVALWQLRALGFGGGAVEHRLRAGSLYQLFRGVYVVGCASVSGRGRVMGGTLAGGPGAIGSHYAAGAIGGIRATSGRAIDVTVPRSRHGQ